MPVLQSSAYVSVESVTTLIRAIANDMIFSSAGEILTDNANFMLPLLNDALDWFQSELANHGFGTFTKETIITPLSVTQVPTDPGVQVNISDSGYWDGVLLNTNPQQFVPPDLLVPLFLWELRTNSAENWIEMVKMPDGLPSI